MAIKNVQGRTTPAFWKRWLISMVAVYPPLVVLVFAFRALFYDMPTLLSLFLIAASLTALTTGLILPLLHRRLGGWLNT
jgi:antibiotic biosynthesis monooxygenase (ABM) superfamily enzyme